MAGGELVVLAPATLLDGELAVLSDELLALDGELAEAAGAVVVLAVLPPEVPAPDVPAPDVLPPDVLPPDVPAPYA
jgi:hypothetical protein